MAERVEVDVAATPAASRTRPKAWLMVSGFGGWAPSGSKANTKAEAGRASAQA